MKSKRIARVLFFLICSVATALISSAQTLTTHQLTLIHPDDPDFDTLLSANFPGIERLDGYSVVRPYLVLVRNDTAHLPKAYSIEWETKTSEGPTRRTFSDFIERWNPALATERKALAQNELRLISEAFDVSPAEFVAQKNWIATKMSMLLTHPPYTLLNVQSITVSVDAAVFEDGAYTGADKFQLLLRYQAMRDAERDMAEAVLQLLDAKAPVSDILAFLDRESEAGLAANTSTVSRDSYYALYRGREAQTFRTLYHRGGIETLMTRAWSVAQHPREKIARLAPQ
ncbi:MAG: hypothetical protein WA748_00825 [Candidatus Acidiferrum sp.]